MELRVSELAAGFDARRTGGECIAAHKSGVAQNVPSRDLAS